MMEVSGVSGPTERAAESAAARLPAPPKKATEGEERLKKSAGPDPGKDSVQRETASHPVKPVVNRSGTRMHLDQESNRIIAQILDTNNQVIKQIPPEELLRLAARLKDLQAQIFDRLI